MRKFKSEGVHVIDVDGTYLEGKRQKLLSNNSSVTMLPCPSFPTVGWLAVDLQQPQSFPADMPSISQSILYTYLAEGVGNVKGSMEFHALKQAINTMH